MKEKLIEKLDLKFDLIKLLNEYHPINNLLEDVVDHNNAVLVQKKFHLAKHNKESNLTILPEYTKSVIDRCKAILKFNSVTYRMIMPNTCYNWHSDQGKVCLHIPLITNQGCRFVYDKECYFMPADGSLYLVNNDIPHTFVNAGNESRVHLTFETL